MIFTLSHKQFNKSDSPFLLFSCKKIENRIELVI